MFTKTFNLSSKQKNKRFQGPCGWEIGRELLYLCTSPGPPAIPAVRAQVKPFKCKAMEFFNRIELRGVVGRAEVNQYNGTQVCNFSLVTEYSTRDKDGNPAVDTVWFNVSAWEDRGMPDFQEIQKGAWIGVTGRVRVRKYTTQDNEERSSLDVIAQTVTLIPRENTRPQPQRNW